ncbi:MAG: lysylphosphatidylglycerol synthase transmembrane domain-containing protein [Candidatus Zixiibacteriota bacterium]
MLQSLIISKRLASVRPGAVAGCPQGAAGRVESKLENTRAVPYPCRDMKRHWISRIIKFILAVVVAYFVWRQLSQNWQEVLKFEWNIAPGELALSIALHLVTFAAFSKVWSWLIRAYGINVQFRDAFKISYLASLGRYIPGKIWPVFGMVYLARQVGIKESESVSSWAVAMLYAILSSAVLCVALALIDPSIRNGLFELASSAVIVALAIGALSVSAALLLLPGAAARMLNLGLRILRRDPISLEITRRTSVTIFLGYLACWILYGAAFWLFIGAMTDQVELPALVGIGAFVIAYQMGYLAIFVPGGIGVRELALAAILGPFVGEAAIGIALAARIWNLAVEILATVIAFNIRAPRERSPTNPDVAAHT